MSTRSLAVARFLDRISLGLLCVSAAFLGASWLFEEVIASAFCLGASFTCLAAAVLLLTYARHVRAMGS